MGARFNVEVALDGSGVEAGAQQGARGIGELTAAYREFRQESSQVVAAGEQLSSSSGKVTSSLKKEHDQLLQSNQSLIELFRAAKQGIEIANQLSQSWDDLARVQRLGAEAGTEIGESIKVQIELEHELTEAIDAQIAERERENAVISNLVGLEERIATLKEEAAAYVEGAEAAKKYRADTSFGQAVATTGAVTPEEIALAREYLEEIRQLQAAIAELDFEQEKADAVVANVGAIEERTAQLRAQLAAYQESTAAARAYDDQMAVNAAINVAGATPGSPQAAIIEANIVEQRRLQEEIDKTGYVAEESAQRGETAWESFAHTVQIVLLYTLVYAIGNTTTEVVKLENQFDSSLTKINTLVGISKGTTDSWRESIENIAVNTGKLPSAVSDAMFVVTSSGLRGKEALDALDASAKASAVGLGDQSVVARAATAAMQVYGVENLTAAQSIGVMIGAVREGNVETTEFSGAIAKVLPLAKEFGVTFDQVGAFMATFTKEGADANVAATSLRAILSNLLQDSSGKGAKELQLYGISLDQIKQEIKDKGLLAGLQSLIDKFHGNDEALQKVFGNIRALTGVLATAKDMSATYAQVQQSVTDSMNNGLDVAFKLWQATPQAHFDQLSSSVKLFGMAFAEGLIPYLDQVTSMMKDLTTADRDAARSFGDDIGIALKVLVEALKLVIDNWWLFRDAMVSLMTIKIIDFLLQLAKSSSIAAIAQLEIGAAAKASKVEVVELTTMNVEGRMASWTGSMNLFVIAAVAVSYVISDIINQMKAQMDEAERENTRMQSIAGSFRDLRQEISNGVVDPAALRQAQSDREALVKDYDDLVSKVLQANKVLDQYNKESDQLGGKGQGSISEEAKKNAEQTLQYALAAKNQDEIRLRNLDQLIAKARTLVQVQKPSSDGTAPKPPDLKFQRQLDNLQNVAANAERLKEIEQTYATVIAASNLQIDNQNRLFNQNIAVIAKRASLTSDSAERERVWSQALSTSVEAGKTVAAIDIAMRTAQLAQTDALRDAAKQKEIDTQLTKAQTTAGSAKGQQIIAEVTAQQQSNSEREKTINSLKAALQTLKELDAPTQKLQVGLDDLTASQQNLNAAQDASKVNDIIRSFTDAKLPVDKLDQAVTTLGEVGFKTLFSNVKPQEWFTSIEQMEAKIGDLRAALAQLDPSSEEYRQTSLALAQTQDTLNKAIAVTPALLHQIKLEEDHTSTSAADKINNEVKAVNDKNIAISKGVLFLKVYEEQQSAYTQAIQIASQVLRQSGEDDISFMQRKATAFAAAYKSTLDTISAQNKENLQKPYEDFLVSFEQNAATIFSKIATGGYKSFKDMFDGIKQAALDMVQQFIQAFIQAQIKAREEAAITAAQQRAENLGQGLDSSSGGLSIGASSSAGLGAIGDLFKTYGSYLGYAFLGWVGYNIYKGWSEARISSGSASIGGATGGDFNLSREAQQIIKQISDWVAGFASQLHLGIVNLAKNSVTVKVQSDGEIIVSTLLDPLGKVFTDMAAALDYAKAQALKLATYSSDVSAVVRAAIHNSDPQTPNDVQNTVNEANQLLQDSLPQVGQQILSYTQTFVDDVRNALDLLGPGKLPVSTADISQLVGTVNGLIAQFTQNIWGLYDQLTGHKEDLKQQQEMQREAFNAQRAIMIAQIQLLMAEVQARIADYEATQLTFRRGPNGGGGGGVGPGGGPEGGWSGDDGNSPGWVKELVKAIQGKPPATAPDPRNPTNDPALAALFAILDNLARALAGFPPEIGPGGVHTSGGGGKGGSASAIGDLQQIISDTAKAFKQSGMDDFQKQMDDWFAALNKATAAAHLNGNAQAEATRQHTAAILAAHGNAAAIAAANAAYAKEEEHIRKSAQLLAQVNQAREQELKLLQKQLDVSVADFVAKSKPGADITSSIAAIDQTAQGLIGDARALYKQGGLTTQQLHQMVAAIKAADDAQKQVIKNGVLQNVSDFLGGKGPSGLLGNIQNVGDTAHSLTDNLKVLGDQGLLSSQQIADLTQKIKDSTKAQQDQLVTDDANSLLQELYGYLGDDKDAAQLKYQITVAELEARRAELQVALQTLQYTQDQMDAILGPIDTLIGKVIAAGPSLFQTGGSSGSSASDSGPAYFINGVPYNADGTPYSANGSNAQQGVDNAKQLLAQYELSSMSELDQEISKINTDFATMRASLGNTIEIQNAYNHAIQDAIDKVFQPLIDLQSSLNQGDSSPLNAAQKYDLASKAFFDVVDQVRAGNTTNVGQIPQLANDLIAAARAAFPTGSAEYVSFFNTIQSIISGILHQYGVIVPPGSNAPPAGGSAPPQGGSEAPPPPVSLDPVVQQIALSSGQQLIELRAIRAATESTRDSTAGIRNDLRSRVLLTRVLS